MFPRIKMVFQSPSYIWQMFITYLPGEIGTALRYKYWKGKLRFLGKKVRLDTAVYFQKPEYIEIDDNSWIDKGVKILAGIDESNRERISIRNEEYKGEPGVVHIGKNNHIAPDVIISGISVGVYISDDCSIAAGSKLYAFSHHYRSRMYPGNSKIHFGPMVPHDRQCLIEGSIFIGKNTGVALNSVILPGVSIPENCFISINSVVKNGRYTPNTIISGNPAAEIANRFRSDE